MSVIVLGYDGSAGADTAVDLVGSLPWPPETSVRLVSVIPDIRAMRSAWGALVLGTPEQIDAQLTSEAEAALAGPLERLAGKPEMSGEAKILHGRPPEAIGHYAEETSASLVVVGSRGRGAAAAAFLGSVSQEVIDLAPCPVLVARTPAVSSILLATDGSPNAEAAERVLAELPVIREVPVRVVSVVEELRPWTIGITPVLYQRAMAAQADYEAEARRIHREIAETAAERLAAAGADASAETRLGNPAAQLLAAAAEVEADLIVVGSRGRTGLVRLALGSVARRVVQQTSASVLVV